MVLVLFDQEIFFFNSGLPLFRIIRGLEYRSFKLSSVRLAFGETSHLPTPVLGTHPTDQHTVHDLIHININFIYFLWTPSFDPFLNCYRFSSSATSRSLSWSTRHKLAYLSSFCSVTEHNSHSPICYLDVELVDVTIHNQGFINSAFVEKRLSRY